MAFSILEEVEKAKGLLSVKQVAEMFRLCPQTIYTMAASKELPSIKFRGSLRFDPKALGYYLRKQDPTLAAAARYHSVNVKEAAPPSDPLSDPKVQKVWEDLLWEFPRPNPKRSNRKN